MRQQRHVPTTFRNGGYAENESNYQQHQTAVCFIKLTRQSYQCEWTQVQKDLQPEAGSVQVQTQILHHMHMLHMPRSPSPTRYTSPTTVHWTFSASCNTISHKWVNLKKTKQIIS